MKMRLSKLSAGLIAIVCLAGVPGRLHAGPVVTLDDMLKGMSLQVGDLVFSGFGNFSSVGFAGGKAVDPKFVAVIPTFFNGSPGLLFQSPSQFIAGMGQQQETHFTFNVKAASSLITGAALSFTAAAYGGGSATIVEAVTSLPNGLIVSTLIPQNYQYGQLTNPLTSIAVSKDIALVGGTDPGALTFLSDFTQSFTTSGGGVVPEPASVTLMAIGFVALVGYRWRAGRRT